MYGIIQNYMTANYQKLGTLCDALVLKLCQEMINSNFTSDLLNSRWSYKASWDDAAFGKPRAICSLTSRSLSRLAFDL